MGRIDRTIANQPGSAPEEEKKVMKDLDTQVMGHLKLLKDQDFQNLHQVIELAPGQDEKLTAFFKQVQVDTQFLQSENLMDYSLLLIIVKNDKKVQDLISQESSMHTFFTKNRNFIVALGLIDYLQVFNL